MADENCAHRLFHTKNLQIYESANHYIKGQILELPLEQLWFCQRSSFVYLVPHYVF